MENPELSRAVLLKLAEAGVQAPSADNMQPWRFRLGEDFLEVTLDPQLMGLFFDPAQVATELGCGALAENIKQTAGQLGLSTAVHFVSQPADGVVIRLRFSSSKSPDAGELANQIFERHTNRELYRKRQPVSDSEREALSATVAGVPGHSVTFYDQPGIRKKFIQAVYQADTIRFSHPVTHRDFHHVLRFGQDVEKTRDGLAQSTLGIESFFVPVLKLLKPWWLTGLLNHIGLYHLMALRGVWLPMATAPSLVSIVHSGVRDNFVSGMAMQRFWLEATRLGLSVQPLGAFPLFLARLQLLGGEGFTDRQIEKLEYLFDGLRQVTPSLQEDESQLVMLFRVGHGRKVASRSLRRPIQTFIN